MEKDGTRNFQVVEDDYGELSLLVYGEKDLEYLHGGYENRASGQRQLVDDIRALQHGADPVKEGWDGNAIVEMDEKAEDVQEWFEHNGGEVIADSYGIYPEKMGGAGMEGLSPARLLGLDEKQAAQLDQFLNIKDTSYGGRWTELCKSAYNPDRAVALRDAVLEMSRGISPGEKPPVKEWKPTDTDKTKEKEVKTGEEH